MLSGVLGGKEDENLLSPKHEIPKEQYICITYKAKKIHFSSPYTNTVVRVILFKSHLNICKYMAEDDSNTHAI